MPDTALPHMVGSLTGASPLDNPIWHALDSLQRDVRRAHGLAVRYPVAMSRFAALARPTAEAFADLRHLVQPGEPVALSAADPFDVPAGWQVIRSRLIDQMVCERPAGGPGALDLRLAEADVPEMLALTALTEPGPFAAGTIGMGRYYGIRAPEDGRLAAMAGERMRLTGFTEISAVCTDPAYRGRGYGRVLVAGLVAQLLAEGAVPFLHVKTENGAKGLYETLGFRVRRQVQLLVVTPRA